MTFEKKFASLKTKFDKADLKKLPDDFAIQLTMTDEDCGGIFYIANKNGAFSVEPYDYKDNSAAVTGTAAAIGIPRYICIESALITSPLNSLQSFTPSPVLPEAVGPTTQTRGIFLSFITVFFRIVFQFPSRLILLQRVYHEDST